MIQRLAAALVLVLSLAACKENDTGQLARQFVQGSPNVKVLDANVVLTGDSSAQVGAGTLRYVMVRVEFTNELGYDLTPDISHFYLIDQNNNRYQAKDSGSSIFTGVSNSTQVLKQHEKREYTMGFRTTDPSITGTILYER